MELATLYARRGQPGLVQLAKKSGLKVAYIQRLLYVLERRPSVERAELLIHASRQLWGKANALTLEGLTNPIYFQDAIDSAVKDGTAHAKFMLRARAPREEVPA